MRHRIAAVLLAAATTAQGAIAQSPEVIESVIGIPVIEEVFLTAVRDSSNIDSPAVWIAPGDSARILVTGKESNQLELYDGANGELLSFIGRTGSGPGEFLRPNGIAVIGNIALVVERDNSRVQAIRLPGGESLGWFGEPFLRLPYGITVLGSTDGSWEVYVTDAYATYDDQIPSDSLLGARVKHFRVSLDGSQVKGSLVREFGDRSGSGVLKQVESIYADPISRSLMIADEVSVDVKVYAPDGSYAGTTIGGDFLYSEPEGIALYQCGPHAGYWVITDQSEVANTFHILDRETLRHLGAFRGRNTRNTDGIALTQATVNGWHGGVLYAVHDDQSVGAFPWSTIAGALGLRSCKA